ncbi:GUN4 domain-containing protein [Nostoc sp.]|uniref:GUN4 domain-containing protein n=1 Tax=Nostoc sp. TaxID=1180 RepID=UPI002FF94EAE
MGGLPDLYKLLMGYTNLENLLTSKEWKKADYQNIHIMREVLSLSSNEYMSSQDLERFPCNDLCMINDLWMKHSDNKYGFSVQKEIYERVCGEKKIFDSEAWCKFGKQVGWYKKGEWMDDNNYKNGWKDAPKGYFPLDGSVSGEDWKTDSKEYFCDFISYYGKCKCEENKKS